MRIFTPAAELPFAGHPTLGTAWVLGAPLQRAVIELETGMGIVPVELERDESGALRFGRMVQPVPSVQPYPEPDALLAALGVTESELPIERYDNWTALHVRHTRDARRRCRGRARLQRFDCARGERQLHRRGPDLLEDTDVRACAGRTRGPGDRRRGRAARMSCLPARAHPLGHGDRDLPGRGDQTTLHAVCAREGERGGNRAGRGRRARGRGRPWRVPSLSS